MVRLARLLPESGCSKLLQLPNKWFNHTAILAISDQADRRSSDGEASYAIEAQIGQAFDTGKDEILACVTSMPDPSIHLSQKKPVLLSEETKLLSIGSKNSGRILDPNHQIRKKTKCNIAGQSCYGSDPGGPFTERHSIWSHTWQADFHYSCCDRAMLPRVVL
jgi:hypothetical protein